MLLPVNGDFAQLRRAFSTPKTELGIQCGQGGQDGNMGQGTNSDPSWMGKRWSGAEPDIGSSSRVGCRTLPVVGAGVRTERKSWHRPRDEKKEEEEEEGKRVRLIFFNLSVLFSAPLTTHSLSFELPHKVPTLEVRSQVVCIKRDRASQQQKKKKFGNKRLKKAEEGKVTAPCSASARTTQPQKIPDHRLGGGGRHTAQNLIKRDNVRDACIPSPLRRIAQSGLRSF